MRPFARGAGAVEDFDDPRGLGTIRDDDGDELPFHCTAIADGTRTIEVGRRVTFAVVAGRRGRWEATDVTADLTSA
ncbi:MAG TPA: cold shock domain-containing protein [Acidimicrobiales bacterium]|jgi:cold shock CspA family protein|nr:cold shock domain-containing protein [Acidimicrobiales bacterium]